MLRIVGLPRGAFRARLRQPLKCGGNRLLEERRKQWNSIMDKVAPTATSSVISVLPSRRSLTAVLRGLVASVYVRRPGPIAAAVCARHPARSCSECRTCHPFQAIRDALRHPSLVTLVIAACLHLAVGRANESTPPVVEADPRPNPDRIGAKTASTSVASLPAAQQPASPTPVGR